MDLNGLSGNNATTAFSLAQAKVGELSSKLKNHENRAELMKTAKQFEGVFFKQMLDAMDKTVDRSGFMSGGSAEDTFRGMLYDKIADSISTRPGGSGFGLAESIYKQMEAKLPNHQQADKTDKTIPLGGQHD